jgi:hypothetical protein
MNNRAEDSTIRPTEHNEVVFIVVGIFARLLQDMKERTRTKKKYKLIDRLNSQHIFSALCYLRKHFAEKIIPEIMFNIFFHAYVCQLSTCARP